MWKNTNGLYSKSKLELNSVGRAPGK